MSGNYDQFNPTLMFKEWIQKSGRAQTDFMKIFGSMMHNPNSQTFNPLETLKTISDTTRNTQTNVIENMRNMQSSSMETLFNIGQMLPSFMNWGA